MDTATPVAPRLLSGFLTTIRHAKQAALAIAVALGAVLLLPGVARGQGDFEEMAVVFNPLTTRSLDSARVELGLDADQAQLARDLYGGYRSAMRNSIKELEAKGKALMEKAQEGGDWDAVRKGQMKMMKEAFDKVGTLEASFTDDLKAVLTPAQLEKFPSYERARRRENARLIQIMAGEAADVIDILRTLKIDAGANPDLKAIVSEYETSFDRVVSERLALLKEFIGKITDAETDQGKMFEMMADYMPRVYAKARAVRDTNRQTARRALDLLPAGDRERFESEVNRRSFPKIYRATATGKKLEAARKFEDLSESQKTSLDTLVAGYARDVASANKSWADTFDAVQEEVGGDFKKQMSGEETPSKGRAEDAGKKRVEIEKQYGERLEKLLNKEQVDRLPAARPGDEVEQHLDIAEPDFDKDAIKDWKEEAE